MEGEACSAVGFGNTLLRTSRTQAAASAGVALQPFESLPEGQPWSLCCTRSVRPRAPRGGNPPAAQLTLFLTQVPRGRVSGLPTASGGKRFQLWALGLFCTERQLAQRLKHDSFYPFTQQQPNVFVLEYYLDTLWKGALLFVVCLVLVSFGLVSQVLKQETWGFPACGVVVGLWLLVSSLPRRRLVLNHTRGTYHFSIQGRTVCQGPMHLVYVRLALSSDAYGRCFFQLVLCGHQLEPLVLVQLSERYQQMEYLGRHIARKLNINYFDCLATSYRHMVRHWPLGSTFSPGILQRKPGTYRRRSFQSYLDV
ncbi:transmembrane protein 249 [Meles meles]|uniref:transmembrane protein 249 n=1 Tax=Meles meles TaxID=9662 RepID=UPI001E69DD30|nr:transmembrane protein 249 [Meles meles]